MRLGEQLASKWPGPVENVSEVQGFSLHIRSAHDGHRGKDGKTKVHRNST
jgi:hypothetical protein